MYGAREGILRSGQGAGGQFCGKREDEDGRKWGGGEEQNGGKKREAKRRVGRGAAKVRERMWAGDFFAEGAEKYLTLCQGSV